MRKKLVILTIVIAIACPSFAQRVGIGTATPDGSAALDITSTNKGLLIPRMDINSINAIANPARGLLVYDSVANLLMVNVGLPAVPNWQAISTTPILQPAPPVPQALLKEIDIPRLPAPFYHFDYNAAGRVSSASFASGLTSYNVIYNGDRIIEMRNNTLGNTDRLQYFYDNLGRVTSVFYTNENNLVYKKVFYTYDGQKLIKLERERGTGIGFILEKRLIMTYYADGNLMELKQFNPALDGSPEQTYTDKFEQYDNKLNVDGFDLLHPDFFDHLVLVPTIQLQKNNPGKVTRTGDGPNFINNYTYTYTDKNAPLTRHGDLVFSSGADAGQTFTTNSFYSYY
jgi:hypothetical protein